MSITKQELLAWVNSLPSDMEALPFDLSEMREERLEWSPDVRHPGLYERKVITEVALRVRFSETEQAHFKRTYENPDGEWSCIVRRRR